MMAGLDDCIRVNARLCIPRADIVVRYARSSGPGGQNVNKAETAVELLFDVAGTPLLDEPQRARVLRVLGAAVDSAGLLHSESSGERSQLRNRAEAERKLAGVLRRALLLPKPRRPTAPTRASKERRLDAKRKAGQIKRNRRGASD